MGFDAYALSKTEIPKPYNLSPSTLNSVSREDDRGSLMPQLNGFLDNHQ